jgi:hypothetical protein
MKKMKTVSLKDGSDTDPNYTETVSSSKPKTAYLDHKDSEYLSNVQHMDKHCEEQQIKTYSPSNHLTDARLSTTANLWGRSQRTLERAVLQMKD